MKIKFNINESRAYQLKTECAKLTTEILKQIYATAQPMNTWGHSEIKKTYLYYEELFINKFPKIASQIRISGMPDYEDTKYSKEMNDLIKERNLKIDEITKKLQKNKIIEDQFSNTILLSHDLKSKFNIQSLKYTIHKSDKIDVGGAFSERQDKLDYNSNNGEYPQWNSKYPRQYDPKQKGSSFDPGKLDDSAFKNIELEIYMPLELPNDNEGRKQLYIAIYQTLYHELTHAIQAAKLDPKSQRVTLPSRSRDNSFGEATNLDNSEKILQFIRHSFLEPIEIEAYAKDFLIGFKKNSENSKMTKQFLFNSFSEAIYLKLKEYTKLYYEEVDKNVNQEFLKQFQVLDDNSLERWKQSALKRKLKYIDSITAYFQLFVKKLDRYYLEKYQFNINAEKINESLDDAEDLFTHSLKNEMSNKDFSGLRAKAKDSPTTLPIYSTEDDT